MTFSIGKKRLFTLFFFLHYIVYAISPLTYTFPESSPVSPVIKGVRLFLWELVMEIVVPSEETEPDNTGDTVLIKKKRARLPENAAAKLLPFDTVSVPRDHYAPPVPLGGRTPGHVAFHGTREGFSPVYAGHSPPLG